MNWTVGYIVALRIAAIGLNIVGLAACCRGDGPSALEHTLQALTLNALAQILQNQGAK